MGAQGLDTEGYIEGDLAMKWYETGHRAGKRDAFSNLTPGVYLKCTQCLRFALATTIHYQGGNVLCEECG